jgi:PAS domain S-box-containing protein
MPNPIARQHPLDADRAQLYDILISELADFAVFLTDPDGYIVSWNPGVESILGYSESEWLGQSVSIIFLPEDRANGTMQEEIARAARQGQSPDIRWHVRRDGSRFFVEGTLVALRDDAGQLLGFSKVMRDITERKKRELELQDALAYTESIVDTVRRPLLVLDPDLRVRSANRSFYQTFLVSKEETENQPLYELGNGQWNIPQLRTLLEELLPKETTIEDFEVEHHFPKLGHKVIVLNARRLLPEGNQTELTLLALDDITDRRQAEKALAESENRRRLIMDAAPALISYVDRNLRYRLVNSAYERWFGASPRDLIGKPLSEVFADSVMATIKPHVERVLAGETVSFEADYRGRPDGLRTLQVCYTPDLDERGDVQGFVVLGSDTTERKKAELALRANEERWRGLFERMTEGFFVGEMIYGANGEACDFRLLEVNPAFEKLTGLANAAGKTIREVIPGIQDELIRMYGRLVSAGEPAQFETYIPALQNRWYEARARSTERDRFAVLFLDITERKNAEAQLRQDERRQAALVTLGDRLRDSKDVSSITLAAMEIAGTALGVARAGYGEVDATQEYVIIENDWTNGAVPTLAGKYHFEDFGQDLGARLKRGEFIAISDVSSDPITASESERWKALDIRAAINVPLIEDGRLAALLFIQDSAPRSWTDADLIFVRKVADRTWAAVERARAVKELQESEEFSRSVLASTPDCVKVLDLKGRLLTMNSGGCVQMEIEDLSSYISQPWSDLWGEAKGVAEQAVAEAKAGQTARFEGFCPTAKGTPKWWEVVVTPIEDGSGKPVRILSISREITARQEAEQERERLTLELKRSNEELSQFAHIVAHDLQSPLRGVMSFAQLLQRETEGRLPAEESEFLGQIIGNARRMQDLVKAVLRFAQVGQGEIEKKPIEMDAVLDAALESLRTQIQEQGAKITRDGLPRVMGDSIQLAQVLQNLVGNAVTYRGPSKRPEIRIRATETGEHWVFAVEDNGEGIAPEHLRIIFEPLQRLRGAEVPGTGLGLATCERIVNRHGGRIWAESQVGVGSTFYFTLPRV